VTFPLAAKVDVVGKNAHPFYKWAAYILGFGTRPKWNFHKYLVDKNGNWLIIQLHYSPISGKVKAAIAKSLQL